MIQWLNNRQQAIDDAKRDTPHQNVEVWNYVEINRPSDAPDDSFDRVVNRVLPYQKTATLFEDGKSYVRSFAAEHGRVPTNEEYRAFLLNHEILAGR